MHMMYKTQILWMKWIIQTSKYVVLQKYFASNEYIRTAEKSYIMIYENILYDKGTIIIDKCQTTNICIVNCSWIIYKQKLSRCIVEKV